MKDTQRWSRDLQRWSGDLQWWSGDLQRWSGDLRYHRACNHDGRILWASWMTLDENVCYQKFELVYLVFQTIFGHKMLSLVCDCMALMQPQSAISETSWPVLIYATWWTRTRGHLLVACPELLFRKLGSLSNRWPFTLNQASNQISIGQSSEYLDDLGI